MLTNEKLWWCLKYLSRLKSGQWSSVMLKLTLRSLLLTSAKPGLFRYDTDYRIHVQWYSAWSSSAVGNKGHLVKLIIRINLWHYVWDKNTVIKCDEVHALYEYVNTTESNSIVGVIPKEGLFGMVFLHDTHALIHVSSAYQYDMRAHLHWNTLTNENLLNSKVHSKTQQ